MLLKEKLKQNWKHTPSRGPVPTRLSLPTYMPTSLHDGNTFVVMHYYFLLEQERRGRTDSRSTWQIEMMSLFAFLSDWKSHHICCSVFPISLLYEGYLVYLVVSVLVGKSWKDTQLITYLLICITDSCFNTLCAVRYLTLFTFFSRWTQISVRPQASSLNLVCSTIQTAYFMKSFYLLFCKDLFLYYDIIKCIDMSFVIFKLFCLSNVK